MAEFFGQLERLAADLYPYRWLIMAGILIAVAATAYYGHGKGWHNYLWERRVRVGIIGAPVLALFLFLAYDLGSPLFINKTVEEEFPFAFSAAVPRGMAMEEVEDVMAVMAKVDMTVQEEMPESMMQPPTPAPAATPAPTPTQSVAEPLKLKSGSFADQDSIHKGSGQAIIYQGADGSHLLRLENLNVTNGPDLHVLMSPHPNPDNRDEVMAEGSFSLGPLKGNRGNQNYPIPDGLNIAAQESVIIYCMPFHVIFSVAMLETEG